MAKTYKSWRTPQLEAAGFIAAAALSIPAILMVGYLLYQLIRSLI